MLLGNLPESLVRRRQVESLGVEGRLWRIDQLEPFTQFRVARVPRMPESVQ
jgi:hypothetical protein